MVYGLSVAYPNAAFDNKTLSRYLRVSVLPSDPQVVEICGGGSRYVFTLQASVYVRDGTNEYDAQELSDALAAAFPMRHQFIGSAHTFEVQTPPSPAVPIALPGWFVIPVSFRVQTLH